MAAHAASLRGGICLRPIRLAQAGWV